MPHHHHCARAVHAPAWLSALAVALAGCASALPPQSAPAPTPQTTSEAPVELADLAELGPDWRPVSAEDLLLVRLAGGDVAIELAPQFAPLHVDQMRNLARANHFDGATFYRFVEGFVAQAGVYNDALEDPYADGAPTLPAEFDVPVADAAPFSPLGSADVFAAQVGHVGGFQAARDLDLGRAWLAHCPGAAAMARDADPDTGSSHFYIVVGQSPRYLDRNLSVFGRVIDGFEHVLRLERGVRAIDNGVIGEPERRVPIQAVIVAADLPEATRPAYAVMRDNSASFAAHKTEKRVRDGAFFVNTPPEVLDVCATPVPVRRLN